MRIDKSGGVSVVSDARAKLPAAKTPAVAIKSSTSLSSGSLQSAIWGRLRMEAALFVRVPQTAPRSLRQQNRPVPLLLLGIEPVLLDVPDPLNPKWK